MKLTVMTAVLVMGVAGSATACLFDTDCRVGSSCLKMRGDLYGVCVGGMWPGNDHDDEPARVPLDSNYGETCMRDTHCRSGEQCVKAMWARYGVCM